ncbi:hypothetical protein ACFL6X_08565, partial [Candidatus Latescibacterota bacterium]
MTTPSAAVRQRHPTWVGTGLSLCLLLSLWVVGGCSIFHQDLPNEAPVLEVSWADTMKVPRGGTVSLRVQASDEDDDPLIYTWADPLGQGILTDSDKASAQWTAPLQIEGSSQRFPITVTISDQQPDTEDVVESFNIEVVQRSPVLVAPTDTVVSFREFVIALVASATDEDGDAVTIDWEQTGGAQATVEYEQPAPGQSRALITPLYPGDLVFQVEADDGAITVTAELTVSAIAPQLPDGGMVTVEMPLSNGGTATYEMDVYEYPNLKGGTPVPAASWFEAAALCADQGKRLCSPSEWTNACGGPEEGEYS